MNAPLRSLSFKDSVTATMNLPRTLKAWRRREGLTQKQAAERLGRPYSTYFKWEQGIQAPDRWAVEKLLEKIEEWQDFHEVV
jgi:DNA-binding transcriptional regulator YiaG